MKHVVIVVFCLLSTSWTSGPADQPRPSASTRVRSGKVVEPPGTYRIRNNPPTDKRVPFFCPGPQPVGTAHARAAAFEYQPHNPNVETERAERASHIETDAFALADHGVALNALLKRMSSCKAG